MRFSVENPLRSLVSPIDTFSFFLTFLVSLRGLGDLRLCCWFFTTLWSSWSSLLFIRKLCFWMIWLLELVVLLFNELMVPTYFWLVEEYFFSMVGESTLRKGDFYINRLKYGSSCRSKADFLLDSSISIQKDMISLISGESSKRIRLWFIGIETWCFNSAYVRQWA